MLLQTLVQLNILILATPALAGWTLLPLAQPGVMQANCVIWQSRAVEAVAPKATPTESLNVSPSPQPANLLTLPDVAAENTAAQKSFFYAATLAAATSCKPFPHAARAP